MPRRGPNLHTLLRPAASHRAADRVRNWRQLGPSDVTLGVATPSGLSFAAVALAVGDIVGVSQMLRSHAA
jgi:hypothetical protein